VDTRFNHHARAVHLVNLDVPMTLVRQRQLQKVLSLVRNLQKIRRSCMIAPHRHISDMNRQGSILVGSVSEHHIRVYSMKEDNSHKERGQVFVESGSRSYYIAPTYWGNTLVEVRPMRPFFFITHDSKHSPEFSD
jgi:hypothetical protein